jgi:outer membrane scaffolding protein for murein synthesis (MipA/OmpV family)
MTRNGRISPQLTRAGLALILTCWTGSVLADENAQEKKSWQTTLGVGAVNLPEYPGSEKNETRVLPLISVRYKRFFLGGAPGSGSPGGLGAYLYDGDSFSMGVVASPDTQDPREESDDVRLRGLGDIDAAVRAGLFASYRIGWLTLSANGMTDVSDKQQGTVGNFDAEATYRPFPKLILSGGPGVTWSNAEYMQTFYGVTAAQSALSAFAPYTPGAGVSAIRVSLGARYLWTPHWFLGARVTASQLQGDAADSPVIAEKNQNLYALFFGYRF